MHQDDVEGIVSEIVSADFIAIASPSYWAGVPGQLKTLFDRTTPYGDTNPNRILKAEKSIQGAAIAVRAGTHEKENDLILDAIQHYYGHLGIQTISRISYCGIENLEDLIHKYPHAEADMMRLGRRMLHLEKG